MTSSPGLKPTAGSLWSVTDPTDDDRRQRPLLVRPPYTMCRRASNNRRKWTDDRQQDSKKTQKILRKKQDYYPITRKPIHRRTNRCVSQNTRTPQNYINYNNRNKRQIGAYSTDDDALTLTLTLIGVFAVGKIFPITFVVDIEQYIGCVSVCVSDNNFNQYI